MSDRKIFYWLFEELSFNSKILFGGNKMKLSFIKTVFIYQPSSFAVTLSYLITYQRFKIILNFVICIEEKYCAVQIILIFPSTSLIFTVGK